MSHPYGNEQGGGNGGYTGEGYPSDGYYQEEYDNQSPGHAHQGYEGDYQYDQQHDQYYYDQQQEGEPYYDEHGYAQPAGHYDDGYPEDSYATGSVDPYASSRGLPHNAQGGRGEDASETFSDFTSRGATDADYYGRQGGVEYMPTSGQDYREDSYDAYGQPIHPGQGGYGNYRSASSQMSYGGNRSSGASTPIYGLDNQNGIPPISASREPYPAWTSANQIPITKEEIEDIFIDLANKFGFQRDSMRNMYDHLMVLLDSRSSRMTPNQALLSLHADYIGGENANYRKWYFAAQLDLDDDVGFRNMKLGKTSRKIKKARKKFKAAQQTEDEAQTLEQLEGDNSLEAAEYRWKARMNSLSQQERVRQIALYLLCWGEANQVRFMPECLCFIFKCCDDYFNSPACQSRAEPIEEGDFLNRIITPLYRYVRDQSYEILDGKFVKREKDHNKVIGYDDINQLFWYPEGIERIVFEDGSRLIDIPSEERYLRLGEVLWKKVFFKTYKETRSWFHMAVNFNRIWVFHITAFWFYCAYNSPTLYTKHYYQLLNNQPVASSRWASVAIGGVIASAIQIIATLSEWAFVPRNWAGAQHLTRRLMFLIGILILNLIAPVYCLGYIGIEVKSKSALIVGIVGFFIALITFLFFTVMPLGGLFGSYLNKKTRRYVASQTFTASVAPLKGNDVWMSYGLWVCVFAAKMSESYFFLILSIRDPIRDLSEMTMNRCNGEKWFGDTLCRQQARIVLGLMYFVDLILFFLDSYLWYIICNTIFSVAISFYLGISIWTPWRNVFSRLPKRIYSKILATTDMEIKYKPKVLISQVWNAIVISMYREHLLAIDHVQKLLYHQVPSEVEGKRTLRAPTFFVSQDDNQIDSEFFPKNSEAERRISFFAQSLATPIPEPLPVDNMPTFTVLVPHYSEKILLSLREIIREDDQYTRVTLLEYLKQLHPVEWDCFVKDTKTLAEETAGFNNDSSENFEKNEDKEAVKNKIDDLPFYCIGFKSAAPEYTLRTRIWASLRSQTLYRTVSGFMNYSRAIKLLYRVENPEVVKWFDGNTERLERELERMARRKFKFVVSMQRLTKFRPDEMENAEFLLRAYPDLQIAYLDEEPPLNEGEEPRLFSALIDGHCEIMENGQRRPKFRVQLSGNPILGDGKSDNQNHALIFYRGEYIQLIDANQDNYLEECLKIRSVLAEFEELNTEPSNPYVPGVDTHDGPAPVAILGAREYIFSENIGVLGDVAAGKEQTFGTLFARTLAMIGGKLHYGHPDFLNGIFMTTRGGVAKAQKGLHLNEDIYAGMNAMLRGGRIKHCEYYQCGKGRDLGFGSILNFTTKIGTGMGEQILSREYYYLGTQLPLHRFLSFFYAHPGFHVNNLFIVVSVQSMMYVMINIGALTSHSIVCWYDRYKPITDPFIPKGCYMLQPVIDWVRHCIFSIFIVFWIAFIPLVVQELLEKGLWRAFLRFAKQLGSLSPLFEVFVCQIYAHSLLTDLAFGGARYISTGRGVATARIPFSVLYSRFAGDSIYFGARAFMMLIYSTISMWQAALLWFYITLAAMCVSPFWFNPHQFAWMDFFIDYRDFIRWLSRGNSKWHRNSWIGYARMNRTRITGYKRKVLGLPSEKAVGDAPRAGFTNLIFTEFLIPVVCAAATFVAYTFANSQNGVHGDEVKVVNSTLRVVIITLGPIVINAGAVLVLVAISCCAGPLLGVCCKRTASVMAGISHGIAVIIQVVFCELMWFLQAWDFASGLLGMICCVAIQRVILKLLVGLCLTREFKHDNANRAWWSGKWYSSGLGWMAFTQPSREFVCKIVEQMMFSGDFILGHLLLFFQFPVLCIPMIDRWHSMLLFWLRPSRQIRPPIYSLKQNKLRKRMVKKYATMYFLLMLLFVVLLVAPAVAGKQFNSSSIINSLPSFAEGLFQPTGQSTNDTGKNFPSTISTMTTTPSLSSYSTKP